jgi:hypothetical protein
VSEKDMVSEHERDAVTGTADQECLSNPRRLWMRRVRKARPPCATVTEQPLELRSGVGRCDDGNIPNAGEHESRNRIVDHRLVLHGRQLLADRIVNWIEPSGSRQRARSL